MNSERDDRTSMSSESSHYKSARDNLTGLDDTATLMADSSSDYTFVSDADLSIDDPLLHSSALSSNSHLSSTLTPSEVIAISSGSDTENGQPDNEDEAPLTDTSETLMLDKSDQSPLKASATHHEVNEKSCCMSGSDATQADERVRMVNGQLEVKLYESRDEFERQLPDTVSVLEGPFGSRVYLVGTAHFSEESMNDVSFVIRNVRPDFVMVELCASRIHILRHDEETLLKEAQDLNAAKLRDIFRTNGVNGIFYILLLNISAKMTKQLGRAPGGEFRRAFAEAHRLPGCKFHLGDRPINITLQRALQGLSIWETIKLVWRLASSDNKISPEEVEECKKKSMLEQLMEEMANDFPVFDDVFVKERDLYLSYSLQNASMPIVDEHGQPRPVKVVGVVGLGHAAGIKRSWGKLDPKRIEAILKIPPTSTSKLVLKYTVKYGLLGLICYGVYRVAKPRLSTITDNFL